MSKKIPASSKKIPAFTTSACKEFSEAAEVALAELCHEFGVTMTTKGGRFDATLYNPRWTFTVLNAESGIPADFSRYAVMFGLAPADYGRTFVSAGTSYKIVGLNMKAPRYPILAERGDGKRFKFPADIVKRLLAA